LKIVKFLTSSALATLADFLLYSSLVTLIQPHIANIISTSAGMLINFSIQRRWVFFPTKEIYLSFILSLMFSLGGLALGTFIIFGLTTWTMLSAYPIVAKVFTICILFTYNYETKRLAFGDI